MLAAGCARLRVDADATVEACGVAASIVSGERGMVVAGEDGMSLGGMAMAFLNGWLYAPFRDYCGLCDRCSDDGDGDCGSIQSAEPMRGVSQVYG